MGERTSIHPNATVEELWSCSDLSRSYCDELGPGYFAVCWEASEQVPRGVVVDQHMSAHACRSGAEVDDIKIIAGGIQREAPRVTSRIERFRWNGLTGRKDGDRFGVDSYTAANE